MSRNSIPKPVKAPGGRTAGSGIAARSIKDVEELEKLTLEKANKALSTIENALAVWDSSREKPDELKPRIGRLKYFYEALANWEKKMLKAMAQKESMDARINMLREFGDLCHAYA